MCLRQLREGLFVVVSCNDRWEFGTGCIVNEGSQIRAQWQWYFKIPYRPEKVTILYWAYFYCSLRRKKRQLHYLCNEVQLFSAQTLW
jgi:hypothetical protein